MEHGILSEALNAQINLGLIAIGLGDVAVGRNGLQKALHLARKIDSQSYVPLISTGLALERLFMGELQKADAHLPPQRQMVIGKTTPLVIAYALAVHALLKIFSDRLEEALSFARQSLTYPSNPLGVLLAHWVVAMSQLAAEQVDAACRTLATGIHPFSHSNPDYWTCTLPVWAVILARQGESERATHLLSLATNHPSVLTGWRHHWQPGVKLKNELQQTLGPDLFRNTWEEGKRLDLAKTIDWLVRAYAHA